MFDEKRLFSEFIFFTILISVIFAAIAGADVSNGCRGKEIDEICISTYEIFDTSDEETSSWPYRLINAVHFQTRRQFVSSLMTIKPGDEASDSILAESERLLRRTGFLNPVYVECVCENDINRVYVETHDQWTTKLALNYGRYGKRQEGGVSLEEQNFLGWGKTVVLDVRYTSERTTNKIEYYDPLLFGSRWRLNLGYNDATDGHAQTLKLRYPFFSLSTSRAGGIEWQREKIHEWLWSEGEKVAGGDEYRRSFRIWYGYRLPGQRDVNDRFKIGFFSDKYEFENWKRKNDGEFVHPEDLSLSGVEFGWERETDSWEVVEGFRAWARQEDIPLGPNWEIKAGIPLVPDSDDPRTLSLEGSFVAGMLKGRQYSWCKTDLAGRIENGEPVDFLTEFELGSAMTGKMGWRAKISWDMGYKLNDNKQLTLGVDEGLRGWDPDTFDGTSRVLVNMEWRRRLTDEIWNLGVFGLTFFVDTGKTWGARIGPDTDGWRTDFGFGLTAESTKAAVLRLIRLEVAFPDDAGGPVFLITGIPMF